MLDPGPSGPLSRALPATNLRRGQRGQLTVAEVRQHVAVQHPAVQVQRRGASGGRRTRRVTRKLLGALAKCRHRRTLRSRGRLGVRERRGTGGGGAPGSRPAQLLLDDASSCCLDLRDRQADHVGAQCPAKEATDQYGGRDAFPSGAGTELLVQLCVLSPGRSWIGEDAMSANASPAHARLTVHGDELERRPAVWRGERPGHLPDPGSIGQSADAQDSRPDLLSRIGEVGHAWKAGTTSRNR